MPVAPASPVDLLELISRSGIATAEALAEAAPDGTLPADPRKAAAVLMQKGVITRFQAQQLLQGRHKGFVLGPYVVLDLLGRGGMGAVYLAKHTDLHRKVAVKLLVPVRDTDQKLAYERFIREARSAAALDHPNIVRLFDVSRYNDVPFLVMEYVDGETLQQILDRSGPLPPSHAADAIAQAAAGLQHAHERNFVHRDIKPGNLIRDRFGSVKILDMGLARSFEDPDHKLTETLDSGAVVGTADFISPEQALNAPNIDIRSDIYSLGDLLHARGREGPVRREHDTETAQPPDAVGAETHGRRPDGAGETLGDRGEDDGEETGGPVPDTGRGDRGTCTVARELGPRRGRALADELGDRFGFEREFGGARQRAVFPPPRLPWRRRFQRGEPAGRGSGNGSRRIRGDGPFAESNRDRNPVLANFGQTWRVEEAGFVRRGWCLASRCGSRHRPARPLILRYHFTNALDSGSRSPR